MLEELYERILCEVGEDPAREGLRKTPHRAAEALRYMTRGYAQDVTGVLNGAVFAEDYEDLVMASNIEFYSLCEHHLLPFFGKVHIAYLPAGRIIGVSKLARLVDVFARRLQVQERMTVQVATALEDALRPKGVGVVVEARHMCMMARGVEKQNSKITTSEMRGHFRDHRPTRDEFLNLLALEKGV
ncbi:MAG: GTP cyclohydrolase I FolE [Chthonomonadales bacterium]|nr:GTP cyclohydrolase I FolE [Chthonomonadales bacterium]